MIRNAQTHQLINLNYSSQTLHRPEEKFETIIVRRSGTWRRLRFRIWQAATGSLFHQHFMSSFYACRSQMRKNTFKLSIFFCTFGICTQKNCLKNVGEIDYRWQFHQTFYEELFCMKMFCEAFHFLQLGFVIFL